MPPDRDQNDLHDLTEHLRGAARELIAAGRVLLDAAERLVDEPGAAVATARSRSEPADHREEEPGLQHIDVT